MRRYSFFIGALSAVITFVALSAFTGRRPWNRGDRGPYGWHRDHCDRDGHDKADLPVLRLHNGDQQTQPLPIDSTGGSFNQKPDSVTNR